MIGPGLSMGAIMAYRRIGELIEYDGKLAQYRGDRIEYDGARAWHVEAIMVSTMEMVDSDGPVPMYRRMIGHVPMGGNWSGYVHLDWSDVYIDLNGGTLIDVRTEI